jgi:hypothetical protein
VSEGALGIATARNQYFGEGEKTALRAKREGKINTHSSAGRLLCVVCELHTDYRPTQIGAGDADSPRDRESAPF